MCVLAHVCMFMCSCTYVHVCMYIDAMCTHVPIDVKSAFPPEVSVGTLKCMKAVY